MAVKNTARFLCICLPLLLGLSLLTAVLAGQVLRVSGLLKSGFLIPMAVPAASAVVFFRLMFDKNGWMNGILQAFGMEGQDWLASGNAFAVLIACYIWKNLGYDMVLWMAGLSSIPKEQYEAARVQGAGELQCFLYITLPQLKETAFVTALLSFVNGFRVFREAYLIAGDYPHESIYMLQHLFNNRFPGRRALWFLYMLLMILPFQVTMVSGYLVLSAVHLMDTHWAVILPGVFSTLPVFILKKTFFAIPREILDAAEADGAGELRIFLLIGIPLGRSGIFSIMILGFLEYWNAIEHRRPFIRRETVMAFFLYLRDFTTSDAAVSFAASIVMLLPALLLFFFGQEYLEQGIAASGIKE